MKASGTTNFERFFRQAAGLDVDKDDLKRVDDFLNHKLHDLLVIGNARTNENDRDLIELADLPITKGLQESIHQFRKVDQDVGLAPILDQIEIVPPTDRPISDEALEHLPEILGGIALALARTFPILDPEVENPSTEHWERAFRVLDLLL